MYNINFCKNTRRRFQQDFRRAEKEAVVELRKKALDEERRAMARKQAQRVKSVTEDTITIEAVTI